MELARCIGCGVASASESKALADYLVAEVTQQVTQCLQAFAAAIKSQMESSYAAEMLAAHNVMTSAIKSEMLVVHNVMASAIKSAAHEVMTKTIINSLPSDAGRSEIVADVSSAIRSAHEVMTRTIISSLSSGTDGSSSRRSSLLSDHEGRTNRDGSVRGDNHNRAHPPGPRHARCNGITKKGEQCRRETSDGSGHCKSHREGLVQHVPVEQSPSEVTRASCPASLKSIPPEVTGASEYRLQAMALAESALEQQHAQSVPPERPCNQDSDAPLGYGIGFWARAKTSALLRASMSAGASYSSGEQQHPCPSVASRPTLVASEPPLGAFGGDSDALPKPMQRSGENCGIIVGWTEQAIAPEQTTSSKAPERSTSSSARAMVGYRGKARASAPLTQRGAGTSDASTSGKSAGEQQDNVWATEAKTRTKSTLQEVVRPVATPAAPAFAASAAVPSRSLPVSRNDLVNSKFVLSTGIDFEEDGAKEQPPRKIAVKSYMSPTDTRFIDFSNYDNLDAAHLDGTYNLYVDNRLVLKHVKLRDYISEIQLIGRIFKQS